MIEEKGWIIFLFFTTFILGGIEALLAIFWAPFYMRIGIPVSVTRFSILKIEEFEAVGAKLIKEGLSSKWYPSLAFKQISDTELAFKSELFEFKIGLRVRSPMRGIITLNQSQKVSIKGFLPLSTPLVFIFALMFFRFILESFSEFSSDGVSFLPTVIVILVVNLLVQLAISRRVSQRIAAHFEPAMTI